MNIKAISIPISCCLCCGHLFAENAVVIGVDLSSYDGVIYPPTDLSNPQLSAPSGSAVGTQFYGIKPTNSSQVAIVGQEIALTEGVLYTSINPSSPNFGSPATTSNALIPYAMDFIDPSQATIVGAATLSGDGSLCFPVDLSAPDLSSPAATTPLAYFNGIAQIDSSHVAIVGYDFTDGYLFPSIDLNTLQFTNFESVPGVSLQRIVLLDSSHAAILGYNETLDESYLYVVDLTNPQFTPLATASAAKLTGIVKVDATHVAIVGGNESTGDGYLYASVDLDNPDLSSPTITVPLMSFLDITLTNASPTPSPVRISTSGLGGNNLSLANYLNASAPASVIQQIAHQPNIPHALYVIAPTRNAIASLSVQTTQIAMNQFLANHLGQLRLQPKPSSTSTEVSWNDSRNLLASASDKPIENISTAPAASSRKYSPWLSLFGDFSKNKTQDQTPAFHTGSGGFVLGYDYRSGSRIQPIGIGAAYAHTHVHEKNHRGHANVDQGAIFTYATLHKNDLYLDMALWGGYDHIHNVREIVISGFQGRATSSTHGWQLSPHLEMGYDFWLHPSSRPKIAIEPFAAADWGCNWEKGFQEKGAHPYNFGQQSRWSSFLRCESGLRFAESIEKDWGTFTLREKASYAYQKAFKTGTISSFLIGSPGSFTVRTFQGAQNLGIAELELLFFPRSSKYPHGSISYQGEFGGKYQFHEFMASIAKDF